MSDNPSRRALIASFPTVGLTLATAGTAAAAGGYDAELLRLAAELEAAWANENKALECGEKAFERACRLSQGLVNGIEKLPATTLAGLRVKALAVNWSLSGEPVEDDTFSSGFGPPTTDDRLLAGIIRDLLAI